MFERYIPLTKGLSGWFVPFRVFVFSPRNNALGESGHQAKRRKERKDEKRQTNRQNLRV